MTAADDLQDLLQKEKEVILEGRMRDLEPMLSRKVHLFRALQSDRVTSAEQLERLRYLAGRNAALLAAAGRGLKAAIKQISDAGTQSDQGFYQPNGERKSMITRADRLEQKI